MKRKFLLGSFALLLLANTSFGQNIPQSQVPSIIVNSFQQAFPRAFDVEWELVGEMYKVEFETGLFRTDHNMWYNQTGKLSRHEEEVGKSDLPQKVTSKIKSEFRGYRVDDVKKITEGADITYALELKTRTEEWKVAFDKEGNILTKVAD